MIKNLIYNILPKKIKKKITIESYVKYIPIPIIQKYQIKLSYTEEEILKIIQFKKLSTSHIKYAYAMFSHYSESNNSKYLLERKEISEKYMGDNLNFNFGQVILLREELLKRKDSSIGEDMST